MNLTSSRATVFGLVLLLATAIPALPAARAETTLVSYGFESGDEGWVSSGDWHLNGTFGHESATSWRGGITVCGDSSLLSPALPLPATSPLHLTWWSVDDYGSSDLDQARVLVTADGGASWTPLYTSGTHHNPGWTFRALDLTSYGGQSVQVLFHWRDDCTHVHEGWFVDDVAVVEGHVPSTMIAGMSPTSGEAGTYVYVHGTALSGATALHFGGQSVPFEAFPGDVLAFTVPFGVSPGEHYVTVDTPQGSSSWCCFVVDQPDPTIASFSPSEGPVGTMVEVTGTGLSQVTGVTFGSWNTSWGVYDDTRLVFQVPSDATPGMGYGFHLYTATGGGVGACCFQVTGSDLRLDALDPSFGIAGTLVQAYGAGFDGLVNVTLGGVSIPWSPLYDGQVSFNVPDVPPGRHDLLLSDSVSTVGASFIVVEDADGDGHPSYADCDDADPTTYPGAIERGSDGVDQDCDGVDAYLALGHFKINALGGSAIAYVDHNDVTGDDRMGIAVGGAGVLYTGDSATGRFDPDTLQGTALGQFYGAPTSNLRTGQLYALGSNGGPYVEAGLNLTELHEIDGASGMLTGSIVRLSHTLPLHQGVLGVFAGWDRVVVLAGGHAYSIALPTGQVLDLGSAWPPSIVACEGWGIWGVAEEFDGAIHLAYVQDSSTIARLRVGDNTVTTLQSFGWLGDTCGFSVAPYTGRWYFHHEGSSQLAEGAEVLGYAAASFETGAPGGSNPAFLANLSAYLHDHYNGHTRRDSAGFGVAPDSTPGYDEAYDRPEPPAAVGTSVQAYFRHPENAGETSRLDVSLYGPSSGTLTWPLAVETRFEGYGHGVASLSWDPSAFAHLPPHVTVELADGANVVDMRRSVSHSWQVGCCYELREMSIRVGTSVTETVHLRNGWNLVSIPVAPTDRSVGSVFHGYVDSLWAWNALSESYEQAFEVQPGVGYWAYASSGDRDVFVSGEPVERLQLELDEGWNLVGGPLGVATLDGAPSHVSRTAWTWDGSGYQQHGALHQGHGYWVYSHEQNATVPLDGAPTAAPAPAPVPAPSLRLPLPGAAPAAARAEDASAFRVGIAVRDVAARLVDGAVFSAAAGATGGFDAALDVAEAPRPAADTWLQAGFAAPGAPRLHESAQQSGKSLVWDLRVARSGAAGPVELRWDPTEIAKVPAGHTVTLMDGLTRIDMRAASAYVYRAGDGLTERPLTVVVHRVGEPVCVVDLDGACLVASPVDPSSLLR